MDWRWRENTCSPCWLDCLWCSCAQCHIYKFFYIASNIGSDTNVSHFIKCLWCWDPPVLFVKSTQVLCFSVRHLHSLCFTCCVCAWGRESTWVPSLPVPDELILHHFKVVAGFQSYLDQTTLFPSLLRGESFPEIEKYFCVDFTFLPGPWAIITPFFVFVFVLV